MMICDIILHVYRDVEIEVPLTNFDFDQDRSFDQARE